MVGFACTDEDNSLSRKVKNEQRYRGGRVVCPLKAECLSFVKSVRVNTNRNMLVWLFTDETSGSGKVTGILQELEEVNKWSAKCPENEQYLIAWKG